MTGWRPALLIAWRDALRHRGRSVLVLVMIALPVLGVTAAAVVIKTADVSGLENADRQLGQAAARIRTDGPGAVVQGPDPMGQGYLPVGDAAVVGAGSGEPLDEASIRDVLGPDVRLLPVRQEYSAARVGDRVVDLEATEVDLGDPLATGLFDLRSGRLPDGPDEVVVNEALVDKGVQVGDTVEVSAGTVTVVGAGRHPELREFGTMTGPPGSILADARPTGAGDWLVGTGAVSWDEVRALNALGGVVTSRAVLADPPDVPEVAEQMGYDTGRDEALAVASLIVVMALLEVVLLAGPAFAVSARRQARALALLAASGGTPAQARRVVLAGGVVLGAVAAVAGSVLGVLTGIAVLPLVQRFQGSWFGPIEVPAGWLAAIAAFGVVSAFLASLVPAWIASRQDVVAVLAGRRGDRRPRASTPVLGLVLLGVGIGGSAYGAATSDSDDGALWIAASAVVSVVGMILVVPIVVAMVARLGRRLPLVTRYAARDAARHRTRTVPAVAAVAATVAGVVALGIANASDELENERTYTPRAAMGSGSLTVSPGPVLPGEPEPDRGPLWDRAEQVVRAVAPAVDVRHVRSVEEVSSYGYAYAYVEHPGADPDGSTPDGSTVMYTGPTVMVADSAAEAGVTGASAARVDDALSDGRMVVFTEEPSDADRATLVVEAWGTGTSATEEPEERSSHRLPVHHVVVPDGESAPSAAIVPASVVEDRDLPVSTYDLRLTGDLDRATETRIAEAVAGAFPDSHLYVERGYQRPDEAVIVLLVLAVLGGVLMLGGTLTATFLALSDARPDMATLSAVGAAPRTRRGVAASYALVIGFVGALLGAGVGFIPGVAISRPLTSMSESGPYLAVPWLLIVALVVALPLLTAGVVGLSARGRLPLVARLD